jgi:hypothetical protein
LTRDQWKSVNFLGIADEVREKTAHLLVELQARQSQIERMSKMLDETNGNMSTVDADRLIQKKLEKDAVLNARLIDDLNSEGSFIEDHSRLTF